MQDIEKLDSQKEPKQEENCEIELLKSQIADIEDRLLRAVAESQNIRKRAEKEKIDISKYSIFNFAKDVLTIRDNLQLALSSCSENTNSIFDGIKLTLSEMDKILSNNSIKMIDSLDKEFDPHLHQAMIELESNDKKPGIVVQVMQEGFMIHDRLLRPALVAVSKNSNK